MVNFPDVIECVKELIRRQLSTRSLLRNLGLLLFAVTLIGSQKTFAAGACGSVIGTFDGVNAYSNGNLTGSGNSCGGTGQYGYQYQCVELVMRYFVTKFSGPRLYCNAQDCLNAASRNSQYLTFKNGSANLKPQPRDAIVFSGGSYGHIVLITEVNGGTIKFMQQNAGPGFDTVTISGNRIGSWQGKVALGIVRHKNASGNVEPSTTNPTDPGNRPSVDPNTNPDTPQVTLLPTPKACAKLKVTNLGNDEAANLRADHNKSADKIDKITKDTEVTADKLFVGNDGTIVSDTDLGKSSKAWYHLKEPKEGWISALYVECLPTRN